MPNNNTPAGNALDGIRCDVANCQYNTQNRLCTAREIKVGPQYANTSADTICATFKPGQSMY